MFWDKAKSNKKKVNDTKTTPEKAAEKVGSGYAGNALRALKENERKKKEQLKKLGL